MFVTWEGGGRGGEWLKLGLMFYSLVSDKTINGLVIVALWITEQRPLHLQESVRFVFNSEHYFASVTCGSFHLNQTSKYVLANKGIELSIVFSVEADALIFYPCTLNLLCVGTAGVSFSKCFTYYNFALPKFQYRKYHEQNIKISFK